MPDVEHCPAAPTGESHRWQLPNQGDAGPARCRYCGAERMFTAARRRQWGMGRGNFGPPRGGPRKAGA